MVEGQKVMEALARLAERQPDARIAIVHDEERPNSDMAWSVMIVFGKEADDSPMVGGAAHGLAGNPNDALYQALSECGVTE